LPRGFKFIDIKMQTRAHKSATRPSPVALEWEKYFKLNSTRAKPIPTVPRASNSFTELCKNESINQLLGLVQWLQIEKKISKIYHHRHCRYRQCPGASNSMKENCKHKPINHLLGLS
jgi:hypothetical protein